MSKSSQVVRKEKSILDPDYWHVLEHINMNIFATARFF